MMLHAEYESSNPYSLGLADIKICLFWLPVIIFCYGKTQSNKIKKKISYQSADDILIKMNKHINPRK